MPRYDYVCDTCGQTVEQDRVMDGRDVPELCGAPVDGQPCPGDLVRKRAIPNVVWELHGI